MTKWKQLLCGMLSLAMAFSLTIPAMAVDAKDEIQDASAAVVEAADDADEAAAAVVAEDVLDVASDVIAVAEEATEETAEAPAAEGTTEETAAALAAEETTEETVAAPAAEDEDAENVGGGVDTSSYVAEYNGTQYETLQAAFNAVKTNYETYAPTGEMETSSVITLLSDTTENIEFSLVPTSPGWSSVYLTLDLNGHTLSGTGDTSSTKGAIYLNRSTSYSGTYVYFTVKDGAIANGYSTSYAGAIYGYGSYIYVTCENVSFLNNTGYYAGAICSHSVTVDNCTFTGNTGIGTSSGKGGAGAIYSPAGKILSMTNCTITGNTGAQGGGIFVERAASRATTLDLSTGNNIVYGNTASTAGDDIFLQASSGSKTLTVELPDITWGTMYQDGTYDDDDSAGIGKGTRYSEGNTTVVSGTVQLCFIKTSTLLRSIGIKVVPETYTVTYTDGVEDAEVFADQSYTVITGKATPAFDGATERTGYTFAGWTPTVAETVTEDAAYTATWTADTYTVTLDAGEGALPEGVESTISVTYDQAIGELPAPTRDGYVFLGWVDADGDAVDADTVYTTADDSTLTATWNTYVVTIDETEIEEGDYTISGDPLAGKGVSVTFSDEVLAGLDAGDHTVVAITVIDGTTYVTIITLNIPAPDTGSDADTGSGTDTGSDADTGSGTDTGSDADTGSGTDTGSDTDTSASATSGTSSTTTTSSSDGTSAKTGDNSPVLLCAALMVVCLAALGWLMVLRRRDSRR